MEEKVEITNEVFLADVILRLSIIEGIIIEKGFITKEEYIQKLEKAAQDFADKVNKSK